MANFSFNLDEFTSLTDGYECSGWYLRPAVIKAVSKEVGTINIEWLDHPGVREELILPTSGQGVFELPTIGSPVLIGFDKGFNAYVVRHIPLGFRELISTIHPLDQGEKIILSYTKPIIQDEGNPFVAPKPTGTYFYMSNVGDISMATAEGDSWTLDRVANTIEQNSMNYRAMTEAGILDFGLVKRVIGGKKTILSSTGVPFGSTGGGVGNDEVLTEFRLRVLETADANILTPPEVDTPFIELTLGTKIKESREEDNKTYEIEKTDSSHAVTDKEIMIQLKTKADQGFEFTVDKSGNLTLKVLGDVRIDVTGNADLSANNMNLKAEDIKIAGNDNEQPVVLEKFLTQFYNQHTHLGNMGEPTGIPLVPASKVPGNDISQVTKVG